MTTYKFNLFRTYIHTATVEIEANSLPEATMKAKDAIPNTKLKILSAEVSRDEVSLVESQEIKNIDKEEKIWSSSIPKSTKDQGTTWSVS